MYGGCILGYGKEQDKLVLFMRKAIAEGSVDHELVVLAKIIGRSDLAYEMIHGEQSRGLRGFKKEYMDKRGRLNGWERSYLRSSKVSNKKL